MQSIWSQTTSLAPRDPLPGDRTTDVAVLGGGLAGVLTAYVLKQKGIEAIVLEADRLGSGQTKNTSAKITSQHGLIYDRLLRDFGEGRARQYADANQWAIGAYCEVVSAVSADCRLEARPAYLYTRGDPEPLRREADAARHLGVDASFTTETALPFAVAGAVRFGGQAQFNPLAFLKAAAAGLTVYEQTRALRVEDDKIITNRGTVTARQVVFATHYPFVNAPGFYFTRMHQERSYVLALKGAKQLDGMYLGVGEDELSFRNYGDLLLLGGGGHRTGENREGGRYKALSQAARELWRNAAETARWSAQDCMTLDGLPYIGRFASSTPNWYVATGFGKWGMSSSMVAARIISGLITGEEVPFAEVFSPQRFTPSASAKAFLEDSQKAVAGLSRQVFAPSRAEVEALPNGRGGVVELDGKKVGVYKDEQGEVFAVSTRCPHLGCQLEWNPDERSWDCPCHGSRFDYKGHLIDNPAQEELDHA